MKQSKSNFRVRVISSLLILFVSFTHLAGQHADSINPITKLKNQFVTAQVDTNRVCLWVDLFTGYPRWKIDSLECYSIKGLLLPNQFKFQIQEELKSKVDLSNGIPPGKTPLDLTSYQPTFNIIDGITIFTEKNLTDKSDSYLAVDRQDRVEMRIQDNGASNSQYIIDKIFQPFITTKPTGQGTGLGLSLAYDIVKAQQGALKVETKEGEGTDFIYQLPLI